MRTGLVLALLGALLVGLLLLNLVVGAVPLPARSLLHLVGPPPPVGSEAAMHRAILEQIRLPRIGLGLLVGAALATGGALLQGYFRNPLADPGLLGVSGGAALGAATVQVLAVPWLPPSLAALGLGPMVFGAFAGALGAASLVGLLGARDSQGGGSTLLLAGVAVNAGSFALLGLLIWTADDADLRAITNWSMGSLAGADRGAVLASAPLLALALGGAWSLRRPLDALLLGEAEALALGVEPRRVRRAILGLSALLVGMSAALAGAIGFVGLVVPQAIRLALGGAHRRLLPASMLLGPALLLVADLLARTLAAPAELPIGVLTALLGAPAFALLLRGVRG